MGFVSWRTVYFASIGLRFVFALSNSYIHPDEHFQSLEVLAGRMFLLSTKEPWEYLLLAPARSFAPLLAVYYVPLKLALWLALLPLQTWYLVRLVFMSISWVVTDWCLYKMLPTKQERIKAIYFVLTSFVSLVYQSHTFSNSIETVLVLLTVYHINELRFMRSQPKPQYATSDVVRASIAIGFLFAFGIFNRVTFPAFLVLPGLFCLQSAWKWPYVVFISAFTFIVTSACCIIMDTTWFKGIAVGTILKSPFQWSQYVVTPYNNLVYNASLDNLAQHGLHPLYTHILVNLPQLMGPGLILLFPRFRNSDWKTTPFAAAMSGLIFLSIVPHQELRFVIPVVPLLCSCFDVAGLEKACQKRTWILPFLMNSWLVFNLSMALLMGVFHQGGVLPALEYLHASPQFQSPETALIWWRTYSPPTWMLNQKAGNLQIILISNENEDLKFQSDAASKLLSIDAMGMSVEGVNKVIRNVSATHKLVLLITPIASFKQNFEAGAYDEVWSYNYHLDMDHLNFSDLQSLRPGLAIYSLL
ncbi:hypothetical protein HF325_003967 [Metschnikowia pulcherrima]|uniref:Mannosyltransferase n=1 Tax=Metschnikowia pulcherrima TaxID=27326 RepID=A0A8H7L979_9ASCO|nr:hypothetical protein HF325_003967 [Metschnikowia pulcherrima]